MISSYVSAKGAINLKKFKYNGVCESLLYKYFLSNFAQFIVDRLPMWLAPNLITLTGFTFLVSANILNMAMNPTFSEDLPNWLYFYSAFCLFLYQTLDNCDGKQARRTNSANALGMLIDHGLDCVSTWLVAYMIMSIFRIGCGYNGILGWTMIGCISFYVAIHNQKHTGLFKLDIINGIDEGLPILQLMIIMTGIIGSDFWVRESYFGLKNNVFFFIFCHMGNIKELLGFMIPVYRILGTSYKLIMSYVNRYLIPQLKETPLTYIFTIVFIRIFAPQYLDQHFIPTTLILGFQWSKLVNLLQLSLITKEIPLRPNYSWYSIQAILIASVLININNYISLSIFLWTLMLISTFSYFKCIYLLTTEISEILKIRLLKIKY